MTTLPGYSLAVKACVLLLQVSDQEPRSKAALREPGHRPTVAVRKEAVAETLFAAAYTTQLRSNLTYGSRPDTEGDCTEQLTAAQLRCKRVLRISLAPQWAKVLFSVKAQLCAAT